MAFGMALSISEVPNPGVWGLAIDGASCSCHVTASNREPSVEFTFQLKLTVPFAFESAPYFAELVKSSCSASASVWAVAGSSYDNDILFECAPNRPSK